MPQSFRDIAVPLMLGLLLLPGLALAQQPVEVEDDDPFDRPGFYVGVGGSYQYNVFQSRIEDVIQDELEGTVLQNASFSIDDSGGVNALVGYRVWSWFALELEYEWISEYDVDGKLAGVSGKLYSIEGHTLTANTKWIVPFWRIQPYLLLGGGIAISDVNRGQVLDDPIIGPILAAQGIDVDGGKHTNAAGRAGLGLDLYITENILVNAQASAVLTTLEKPDIGDIDDLNYLSFAAGLHYRF